MGDELGFKESISNTENNRRRSSEVSRLQAQLIQAQKAQQEKNKSVSKCEFWLDHVASFASKIPPSSIFPVIERRRQKKERFFYDGLRCIGAQFHIFKGHRSSGILLKFPYPYQLRRPCPLY